MAVAATTNYERPPESEIYGRSLGTIRRLGAFMINATYKESIASPEAAQARVEFFTSVEEGFGTDMELGGGLEVRDFDTRPVMGGKVMAKNLKTPISSMTDAGVACGEETARHDRRFLPQLTRSHWDHENALLVDQMANGETPYNTRIVISPFPEEAARESGNAYWRDIGYVPHLKRGFVQLYHAKEDGDVLTGSLSFDGSNKQRLRELFEQLGIAIPKNERTDNWLQYAITDTLSEAQARALATDIADAAGTRRKKHTNTVDVTRQYKPIMERAFNESYVHACESLARGYQTQGARKLIFELSNQANNFNKRYTSALYRMRASKEQFTDDDSVVMHELLVYATIEMMRALHLQKPGLPIKLSAATDLPSYLQAADTSRFQNLLSSFGAEGAKNNRTYSACGLSISLGGNDQGSDPQTAYGGMDKPSSLDEDKLGSRWFTCPKGHMNYRRIPNRVESNCKICGTDVSCKKPEPPKPKPKLFIKKIKPGVSRSLSKEAMQTTGAGAVKRAFALAA